MPSGSQQQLLDETLDKFKDVLSPDPGKTTVLKLAINTGDSQPVRSHPYWKPPRWKNEVRVELDKLLDLRIIQPSDSPWASSIVTVGKKDGGVRLCIDFRAVNGITQPVPYQMPLIEEVLEHLAMAWFISKIDLNKGFYQIPIDPCDMSKTAFCSPWGKFEFKVMPFGLRNGPAVFQWMMDRVLHRDQDVSQVYIDDIAVYSTTWEEHCEHIGRVLERLRGAGLTVNTKKCQWEQTHIEFLGHVIGSGQVSPALGKIEAVKNFPIPKTKKNVCQFLGLTGYYRKFITKYAEHSYYLSEATWKSTPERILWCDAVDCEFNYLKTALCSLPSLTLPTSRDTFLLQTDASGVGLGAILSVVRDREELPVAFWSRKLQPRERRYGATELEGGGWGSC